MLLLNQISRNIKIGINYKFDYIYILCSEIAFHKKSKNFDYNIWLNNVYLTIFDDLFESTPKVQKYRYKKLQKFATEKK